MAVPSVPDVELIRTPLDEELVHAFGDRVFAIGGRVRDAFIRHYHDGTSGNKDHDYVLVSVTLDEANAKLRAMGCTPAVGESFSVYKLGASDIALAGRRSVRIDAAAADVFAPDVTIEEDAYRRDFTMNTLSVRLSDSTLIAPIERAIDDIENGIIHAVGPGTFDDDPLRMLRAIQFSTRFGFKLSEQTARMIRENNDLITRVPAERFQIELDKMLLRSATPSVGLHLMRDLGLTRHILPELLEGFGHAQNRYHQHTIEEHLYATLDAAAAAGGDLEDRWAALLHDIGKPRTAQPRLDGEGFTFYDHDHVGADIAAEILERLRYSDAFTRRVRALVDNHMYQAIGSRDQLSDAAVRRFIRRATLDDTATDLIEKQFRLRAADVAGSGRSELLNRTEEEAFQARVREQQAQKPPLNISHLAIDGDDVIKVLIASGLKPATYRGDPDVGQALRSSLDLVLENPSLNARAILVRRLQSATEQQVREEVSKVVRAADDALSHRYATPKFVNVAKGDHVTGEVLAANAIAYAVAIGGASYTCALTARTSISPSTGQIVHLERHGQDAWHGQICQRDQTAERSIA